MPRGAPSNERSGSLLRDLPSIVIQMIEEREAEAARLGHILHDEIGQLLTAAGFRLEALRRSAGAHTEEILSIQNLFEQVIVHIRELSHSLPSSLVQRIGLTFALERMIAEHRKASQITIRSMLDARAHVSPASAQAMFRIASCALDNALRHSNASLIEVMLRPSAKGALLDIRDNGTGFDVAEMRKAQRGIGLLLMEHSARHAGLQLSVESAPEAGTIVAVYEQAGLRPGRTEQA